MEWFQAKGLQPGFDHTDVWREEHATSFTVAKAMELDVLTAIRAEAAWAQAEGRTLREFAKTLTPRLQELGWWGRKEAVDPVTGEVREVQLGSPRRLATIYRTNMRTARAAGQWERIERTKASHPFLLYELGPSRVHRPEHVGWHGTLLPVDDPWWGTHYPPNGWGCKCRVRQVSRAEAERLGRTGVQAPEPEPLVDTGTGLPTGHRAPARVRVQRQAPPVRTLPWKHIRTGEKHQVPEGIDPGWDYNPGAAGQLAHSLELVAAKLDTAHREDAAGIVRQLVGGPSFSEWFRAPRGDFPVGILRVGDADLVGASTSTVRFSPDTHAKQGREHPELSPAEYASIQDALERGERIQDGAASLIYVLEAEGYVTVVKGTGSGRAVFLTSFRRLSTSEVKRNLEIRRLLKKGRK